MYVYVHTFMYSYVHVHACNLHELMRVYISMSTDHIRIVSNDSPEKQETPRGYSYTV